MIKTFLLERVDANTINTEPTTQYICIDEKEVRDLINYVAGSYPENVIFTVTELTESLGVSKRKGAIKFKVNSSDYQRANPITDMISKMFTGNIPENVKILPPIVIDPEEIDEKRTD